MTTTNTNSSMEAEFNNDDFIYESILDQGRTEEEACRILYNLHHYGSPDSPDADDSVSAWLNKPLGEDIMKLAIEIQMEKMSKAKSSEKSTI
jgi:hypothetical protein